MKLRISNGVYIIEEQELGETLILLYFSSDEIVVKGIWYKVKTKMLNYEDKIAKIIVYQK